MPATSVELEPRSALGQGHKQRSKRSSISGSRPVPKLIELRPKGTLVRPASPTDSKRKAHAQAQKQNRDRMKAALDRIAQMLEAGGGVHAFGGGTKAELVEAAIEYIEHLQGQLAHLRPGEGQARDTC
ncbi:hypothetical protein BDV18DRAFT_161061 [Aspergillus unguis]